ncbi:hypothetical protein [uncultured Xylophilus sp.]|uniref:hypothetical protein n=1 Tax=uncultured Xylophilus sp. TaxID=296832 RepID=UPI0025FD3919|nr:hypothetical protein [uncultured Xylophilus sp.]
MTWQTAAGTSIAISAALPASQTAAAFAALTFTLIGEVTNISSVKGRQYNTATHAPLASAQQSQRKSSFTLPDTTVEMAWDDADAGQILVETASKSNAVYAFCVTKQDGKKRYFTAQVSQFMENIGGVDDKVVGAMTLLRQTETIDAPAA